MLGRRLLPLLFLTCALPLQAQVYTWVDENGQKHFGNQPPATQPVQEVNVRQGYVSDGPPPTPVSSGESTSSTSGGKEQAEAGNDDEKMCKEAIRWTTDVDLPNLKEIAAERKQRGDLSSADYAKAIKGLDKAKSELTLRNCLASKGKEREQYKCLSGGAGVLVCSGALQNALGG